MMIQISGAALAVLLLVVWTHFFADFLLQTDVMATQKSSSLKWLTIHVFVYSTLFWAGFGWKYALVNFAFHWITDFCSSKATSALHKKGPAYRHWFFAVIGLDQAIHMTCLIATLGLAKF